jgi:hypothetical protein
MISNMHRFIIFLFLLSVDLIAAAQPLYKWVEPDGSITFSPKKPAAGIAFEIINEVTSDLQSNPKTSVQQSAPKLPELNRALPDPRASESAASPVVATDQENRQNSPTDSPTVSTNSNRPSTGDQIISKEPATEQSTQATAAETAQSGQTVKNSRKQQQCQDLQKRVVSLERRLKSRLTPEDMDNTVIHMARYQRSYDQHCVQ